MHENKRNYYFMSGQDSIDKNEKICIFPSAEDTDIHYHDFVEIVYFKSGIGTHTIDGEVFNVANGSVAIINTRTEHYYTVTPNRNQKELEVKNIIFYPSLLWDDVSSDNFIDEAYAKLMHKISSTHFKYIQVSADRDKDLASLLSIIEHELHSKETGYLDTIKLCLSAILIKIFRSNSQQQKVSPLLLKHIEMVETTLYYMRDHYHEKLTLFDFATQYHYSTVQFNQIFKKHTGFTFNKYLQKLRCEQAKILLEQTDNTIASICEDVGYVDHKQFYSIFKKTIGVTPAIYRNSLRKTKSTSLKNTLIQTDDEN